MGISELRRNRNLERKNLTRDKLLKAAGKLFASKGYHNTLISDIVKKAGVGQGTFYRNFVDKKDIFERLLDMLMNSLLESFSDMSNKIPQNQMEYREASINAIKKMIKVVMANRNIVFVLLREAITIDKDLENRVLSIQTRFSEIAKYYLDYAIEKGFARRCDSEIVSKAIVGLGFSFLNMWLHNLIDEKDVDRIIEEVVDFAFFGLTGKGFKTS